MAKQTPVPYDEVFELAAQTYGVDADLLKAMAWQESRFNPNAVGPKTKYGQAVGMMQFLPNTAKEYGVNPLDPVESIAGAAMYLRKNLDRFGGDIGKAVAAYNTGPNRSAFQQDDWINRVAPETRDYVFKVLDQADAYYQLRPQPTEETESQVAPPAEPGFMERVGLATKRGFEQIPESAQGVLLGIRSALGDDAAAQKQIQEILAERKAAGKEPQPISWAELEKTYEKEGLLSALSKAPTYVVEQILQSAPSMAVPLAVGSGVAAVSGPAGVVTGPVAGIATYGLQQFGQFMQRQAEEKQQAAKLEPGKAAAAAAATVPIRYFADRFLLGAGKVPAKILGEQAAMELAKRAGAKVAAGATIGVIAEAPTEVLESVAERWQAGLPLMDDEAVREYKESFFGAAAVGGVGGAASGALTRPRVPEKEEEPPAPQPSAAPAAPEAPTPEAPAGNVISQEQIDIITANYPVGIRETVRRQLAGRTIEDLRAEVEDDPEILTNESLGAQAIRSILGIQPGREAERPAAEPSVGVPSGVAGQPAPAQPAAPVRAETPQPERMVPSQPDAGLQPEAPRPVAPTVTETELGTQAPQTQQAEAQGAQPETLAPDTGRAAQPVPAAQPPQAAGVAFTWGEMDRAQREQMAVRAGLKQVPATEAAAKPWSRLTKDQKDKIAGVMQVEPAPAVEIFPEPTVEPEQIAPPEPDVSREQQAIADLEKDRRRLMRRPGGNLRSTLMGSLPAHEVRDISPDLGLRPLQARPDKKPTSLSTWVANGSLNDFLPFEMRNDSPTFDETDAVEYIKERLRNREHYTYETQAALRQIDLRIGERLGEIEAAMREHLSLRETNLLIQEAFDEQRRIDEEAEGAPAKGEDRVAAPAPAVAAEPELTAEEEARLEREAIQAESEQEGLTRPTPESLKEAEDRAIAAEKAAEQARKDAEKAEAEAKKERERREIAEASVKAAEDFQLGQSAEDNLSGQRDLLQQEESKVTEARTAQGGWSIDPEEQRIERELTGKTFDQLTDWAVDNAPDAYAKEIAQKVQKKLREFAKAGVQLKFNLASGKTRPANMSGVRGRVDRIARKDKPVELTLSLNGAAAIENQSGYAPGTRYSTVLHELIHAATELQIQMAPNSPQVKALNDLRNKIVTHFNERVKAGTLTDFEQKIFDRSNNALKTPDEVLAWGLTDRDMQTMLADIKIDDRSLLDRFVDIVRNILGLGRPYKSALEELIRTADSLLEVTTQEIEKNVIERGYMFGPAAAPRLSDVAAPMSQGELFQQQGQQPLEEVVADPDAVKGKEAKDAVRNSRSSIVYAPIDSAWDEKPDPRKLGLSDKFWYDWIDQQVDLKRVIQSIEAMGKRVDTKFNALEKERTYHGRVSERLKQYNLKYTKREAALMDKYGITQRDFGEYLLNRHAPYANAVIASRNPKYPDAGTTIKTADALKFIESLPAERKKHLEEVAAIRDAATKEMQDMLVKYGVETQTTINTWREMFPFYVPIVRESADYSISKDMTQGAGFSQSGSITKSLIGSTKNINLDEIFTNSIMQHERMILRAERTRVAQAIFALALSQPNPKFWLALDPKTNIVWRTIQDLEYAKQDLEMLKDILDSGNLTPDQKEKYKLDIDFFERMIEKKEKPAKKAKAKAREDIIELGFSESQADELVEKIMLPPMKGRYDKKTNSVVYEPNASFANEFVFSARVNGEDKYVLFNGNNERAARMARALKNADAANLGEFTNNVARITRFFASINTQYNPVFGAYNFLRDAQTAALQISTTEIADKRSEVLMGVPAAMRDMYKAARAERKGKPLSKDLEDVRKFKLAGGQTGFRDIYSQTEERAKAIQRLIDPASWADSKLGKFFTAGGTLKVPFETMRKGAEPLFDLLSDYNETMENAVRLSAFKVAKKKFKSEGMSEADAEQKAAVISKEITVNFNQKGVKATQMGAWFAFFNASIQGTASLAKTLAGPLGKTIITGGLLLGVVQAFLLARYGMDDEEPKEFVKARNFVIPYGNEGRYIALPYALGFNVIPTTSRIITEWMISGGEKTSKRIVDLADALLDTFNPVGNAGMSFQTIAPTSLDPIVAIFENKSWTGQDIARKDFSGLNPTPGYERTRDSATAFSREVARFLNYMSGGTDKAPGIVSPTGDQLEYLVGQLTGGVGREALKLGKTVESFITGEELASYNVPLAGRFYGNVNEMASISSTFYRNLTEMNIHQNEIKGVKERKESVYDYMQKNPEARLATSADQLYKAVQELRKNRIKALKEGDKERAKVLENQIKTRMETFNQRVREASK